MGLNISDDIHTELLVMADLFEERGDKTAEAIRELPVTLTIDWLYRLLCVADQKELAFWAARFAVCNAPPNPTIFQALHDIHNDPNCDTQAACYRVNGLYCNDNEGHCRAAASAVIWYGSMVMDPQPRYVGMVVWAASRIRMQYCDNDECQYCETEKYDETWIATDWILPCLWARASGSDWTPPDIPVIVEPTSSLSCPR